MVKVTKNGTLPGRLKKPDKKRENKRFYLFIFVKFCETERKIEEIKNYFINEMKFSISERNLEAYREELLKREILLKIEDSRDLRTFYYYTNKKKIGKPGQQYLRG